MQHSSRLSPAVLVDLERTAHSGGHVECWERFAQAAAESSDIDLTAYTLGARRRVDPIAENVRIVELPPVLSTRLFTGLVGYANVGREFPGKCDRGEGSWPC